MALSNAERQARFRNKNAQKFAEVALMASEWIHEYETRLNHIDEGFKVMRSSLECDLEDFTDEYRSHLAKMIADCKEVIASAP